jgi:hypothetical protein
MTGTASQISRRRYFVHELNSVELRQLAGGRLWHAPDSDIKVWN